MNIRALNKLTRAVIDARKTAHRALFNQRKAKQDSDAAYHAAQAALTDHARCVAAANEAEAALNTALRKIAEGDKS